MDIYVPVPKGTQDFTTTVDLRPEQSILVRIEANLDPVSSLLTWHFICINPATRQLCEDPLVGFLPPNKNPPEGEGSVSFTVMPKPSLPTGTEIRNKATIVFDVNPPINTPEVHSTIDASKPTSRVLPLAPTQQSSSFAVQWSGTDLGSSIRDYTILVAEDGGPYTIWLRDTRDTSATFIGQSDKTYRFYSVARDHADNVEDTPTVPDTTTWVGSRIIVDGDPSDWAGMAPIITDVAGNASPANPEDFINL